MAIPTSSGLSPSNFFNPIHNSTKLTIFNPFHHFISPPTRFVIAQSSVFPSPVLEQEPSPVLPLVEFNYESRDDTEYPEPKPDDPNHNKLLRDLLSDPSSEDHALECYHKAKARPEFRPQKTTLKALLSYLVRSKNWDSVSLVARDMMVYKVVPDSQCCARIVNACIRNRKFKVADLLLESFQVDGKVAAFAYESALRSFNKLHMYGLSIDLYERMKLAQVVMDPGGYVLIMEPYLRVGKFGKVVELFNALEANEKLDCAENPAQIYEVLIEALKKLGRGLEALEQFERMGRKGIPPSSSIYASLIGSLADLRKINIVEELVEEAESKQMLRDPGLFLKLVIMYVKEGLMERTLDVVELMKGANLKVSDCVFCAIVNGYAKKRGLKAAAKVYEELISQGCDPGQVTYASIINVYFRLALFFKAKKVFNEMLLKGFDKCVVAYSTMIVMYGKTGQLSEAMKLLGKMKERGCEPNVWVYNSLIDLHGRDKNVRQVEKLWKEMKRRRLKPDRVSYTTIIGAYSKAREYESCIKFYDEYRRNGGRIDLAMGGIMVGVFSKTNRIDELIKLLQDMNAEGTRLDERLYRSAYNALRDAGLHIQSRWLQESFEWNQVEPFVGSNGRPK